MRTNAIVLERPGQIGLSEVTLTSPGRGDVIVDVSWSGVSTGTEKLLWTGEMPDFPGMGYPLVPGYESVGRVTGANAEARPDLKVGDLVFVPGAQCYDGLRGLFGASAARLVVPAARVTPVPEALGPDSALLALAATAHHALVLPGVPPAEVVIGHGALGRLLARIAIALGHPAPVVWETDPARADGAMGYSVSDAAVDGGPHRAIVDASGDLAAIDPAIMALAHGGVLTLAGFYSAPVSFAYPPAFMREATIRIAAEFGPADVAAVLELVAAGRLSLGGLITHRAPAADADAAYPTAFQDKRCLKMVLEWETST